MTAEEFAVMTVKGFAQRVALILTGEDRSNREEMHVRGIDVISAIWEVFETHCTDAHDRALELVDKG